LTSADKLSWSPFPGNRDITSTFPQKEGRMPTPNIVPPPTTEIEALSRIAKAVDRLTEQVTEVRGELHVLVAQVRSKSDQ
jgi:hypothetical protein